MISAEYMAAADGAPGATAGGSARGGAGEGRAAVTEATDPFDSAEFYDANDSEEISHTCPEDAVDEVIEIASEKGDTLRAVITRVGSVTVRALVRSQVPPEWVRRHAQRFAERAGESFSEDFGDPNDDGEDMPTQALLALTEAVAAALTEATKTPTVWRCEEVAARTYDTEELLEMFAHEIASEEAR